MTYPTIRPEITLDFANSRQLDPRITFSRTSGATYLNPDTGLITLASDHEARFEKEGLLNEESRANVVPYSDLSSGWNFSPAQGSNASAPDGSNNAVELNGGTAGGAGNILVDETITAPSAGTYILSFFVKKPSGSIAAFTYLETRFFTGATSGGKLFFDWSTKDWSSFTQSNGSAFIFPVEEYANGWFRLSIKSTIDAGDLAGRVRAGISDQAGNASTGTRSTDNKILVWGAQWEKGSFPTSYIPTSGSTLARSADIAQITGDNFSSWYNQSESTVLIEYTIRNGSSNSSNYLELFGFTYNNLFSGHFSGRIDQGSSIRTLSQNNNARVNLTVNDGVYKSCHRIVENTSTNKTISISVNGSAVNSSTVSATAVTHNLFKIGDAYGGNTILSNPIARLTYYTRRLTDSELQTITL